MGSVKKWLQRRYILAFLVFWGYFNIYSLRANMSIGIVSMTEIKTTTSDNGTLMYEQEFDWDNTIQGVVLSSFFYGYITTQLVGGMLARRYGGKMIFGMGVCTTALLTLFVPWLADIGVIAIIVARVLMGIFEGVTFSCLYTIWTKWIPPQERSRITTQSNSGSYTGAVFAMSFYGYLADAAGWRSIFWFSGAIGLLWCVVWIWIAAESPEEDKNISAEELDYIITSLNTSPAKQIMHKPNWKGLLTSKAVMALNVALFCETWGGYTMLTLLPKYFQDVFALSTTKSGLFSSLPYVGLAVMMQVGGQLSDRILLKKWFTVTETRKLFMCLGLIIQTIMLIGVGFWEDLSGTIFCLIIAVAMGAFAMTTVSVNALDIAPLHSGLVFGVANTCGTLSGVLSPVVAGLIIDTNNPTIEQWRITFYLTGALNIFGAIIYALFASGERQSWDIQVEHNTTNKRAADKK